MTSTFEQRSIYSGPIRRALEGMQRQISEGGGGDAASIVAAGNALGIVGIATMLGAAVDVPANTLTAVSYPLSVTLAVGRRYRLSGGVRAVAPNPPGSVMSGYLTVSSPTMTLGNIDSWVVVDNAYDQCFVSFLLDGTGNTETFTLDFLTAGDSQVFTDQPTSYFYVEDVGPNQSPALPIPPTPPAWTPVTFQNGWTNVGGGWEPGRYRKIGDMVQLGGNISGGTANQAAFTVPVGFRPAYPLEIVCNGYDASTGRIFTIITVDPGGPVRPEVGGGPSVSLAAIEFSVTP